MKNIFLFICLSTGLAMPAWALPIFGEAAGTISSGTLTLFKDSADPNKVYFFPNSTRFSVDKKNIPLFNFVYWGLNDPTAEEAGGYMSFTTHLASDANQQALLESYMKSHPQMQIAVLPIKSSTVSINPKDSTAKPLGALFTEFNFPPFGPIPDGEIGVNAVLTKTGAKVFKSAIGSGGGGLLNYFYCYNVQGYGPNMDATIEVEMRRIYDYFEASHHGGWGWFGWSLKEIRETLEDKRLVNITMNGGDAKQWEILQAVADTIVARLFVPELANTAATPASSNRLFNFGAGHVHKEELKREVWNWKRRDLVEHEACTALNIKDIAPYASKLMTCADCP